MALKDVEKSVLTPDKNKAYVDTFDVGPEFRGPVWVYKYLHTKNNWLLSIATHGEPQSQKLSLGGFRIVPAARAATPGFDNDKEAIGLCVGMEEKVFYSRLCKVGGPLGLKKLDHIVGGKCVMYPSADARVGQPRDKELLDFGIACLKDFEETSGVYLTTGQDLGHGTMSDGKTSSIIYLSNNFHGSVASDTSKPTAEGNFQLLKGGLDGLGIKMERATIGLIGVGNIGDHILGRLRERGARIFALESSEAKRKSIQAMDIEAWEPSRKAEFLTLPMDALVVNANAGSLDADALNIICKNEALEFICGSENLAMPVAHGSEMIRDARKIYCPTELGGMMGYLTAVEEYLSKRENKPFKSEDMFKPAEKLEEVGRRATEFILKQNFSCTFDEAVRKLYR
ncbi:MAG: hypothetical protein K1X79_05230 [Oligoflexia bacterium]|nr:hypothetical protein [Oligoflexia bacterium]